MCTPKICYYCLYYCYYTFHILIDIILLIIIFFKEKSIKLKIGNQYSKSISRIAV